MDKYQEYLIKYLSFGFTCKNDKKVSSVVLSEDKSKLLIYQGTNPLIKEFSWLIRKESNSIVESVLYFINDQWFTTEREEINGRDCFCLCADFDNRISKIKFCIKSNMTDDIILPVEFVEISSEDKKKYYEKVASEKRDEYISAASISHSTGADLVNIYFQPCCADSGKTEVELYIAKGKYASPGRGTYVACAMPLIGGEVQQLIGKFTVDGGFLFKSISGLANGVYAYKLRQYSKTCEILFESDFYFFKI